MSEMKDFIISSPLLYGHVPGGAISDHKPFCQAFWSSLSHFSALKKGDLCLGGGCWNTGLLGGHGAIMQLLPFVCCNEQFMVDWEEKSPDFI